MERRARMQTNRMKEAKRILKAVAYSAAIGLASATGSAKATDYEIIKLAPPDPNVNFSGAESINNNGIVVGIYGETTGGSRPSTIWRKNFLYQEGDYKELNLDQNYEALFINDWGEILGGVNVNCDIYKLNEKIEGIGHGYIDFNNKGEAVSYEGYYFYGNEECTDPRNCVSGTYLGFKSWAINDLSQITGYTTQGGTVYRPVIWENGKRRDLEHPQYNKHSSGLAINNLGEVAGYYGLEACIWDSEGKIHIIDIPHSDNGWPEAINDKSQVVGLASIEGYGACAFFYDYKTKEFVNLNDLLPENSEWKRLQRAWDINNKGQIVGYGDYEENGETHTYAFLMNPISKPKTLEADLNDDGIVNGLDLAEFGDEWLEMEDWYGILTLFQEDFENAPIDTPYPWNGNNTDEWYSYAYNRAVNISNFPEHNRDFLGNNVLYLENGGGYHLIPSQTSTVKIEYDFLFHHSDQDPNDYGSTFGNGIFLNNPPYRTDTLEIHIQKNYDSYPIQEDGIFWEENYDLQLNKIDEIIPDTWYHIERVINPEKQTEDIRMFNRDTLRELELSYTILTPTETIEGFGFGANSNPPSYVLVDNLKIESVPN